MADAYQYAIRLLAGQDYSVFKLAQKLRQKGFADEDIQDAINEVERKGYLRPQAYLRHRVLALARKGEAANLILRQLEFEHLSTHLREIEAIMAEEGLSAETQILYLLQKKLGRKINATAPTDTDALSPAAAQKVIAFVLRKGHHLEQCRQVLRQYLAAAVPEEEPPLA